MYKDKEIYEKKRDEAFKKWKEYVKSYDGKDDYDHTLKFEYNNYDNILKIINEAIKDDTKKIRKRIEYRIV
jgi:hypothetical protein